ncbi:hypothetical protein BDR22DRAFT_669936 [Usnea florida]
MPQTYLLVSNCLVLYPVCRSIFLFVAPGTNALHRHCGPLHFSGSEGPSEHVHEDCGHVKPFPSGMLTVFFFLGLSALDCQTTFVEEHASGRLLVGAFRRVHVTPGAPQKKDLRKNRPWPPEIGTIVPARIVHLFMPCSALAPLQN